MVMEFRWNKNSSSKPLENFLRPLVDIDNMIELCVPSFSKEQLRELLNAKMEPANQVMLSMLSNISSLIKRAWYDYVIKEQYPGSYIDSVFISFLDKFPEKHRGDGPYYYLEFKEDVGTLKYADAVSWYLIADSSANEPITVTSDNSNKSKLHYIKVIETRSRVIKVESDSEEGAMFTANMLMATGVIQLTDQDKQDNNIEYLGEVVNKDVAYSEKCYMK